VLEERTGAFISLSVTEVRVAPDAHVFHCRGRAVDNEIRARSGHHQYLGQADRPPLDADAPKVGLGSFAEGTTRGFTLIGVASGFGYRPVLSAHCLRPSRLQCLGLGWTT